MQVPLPILLLVVVTEAWAWVMILNGFAKDLLKDDPAANNAAMDNILNQFQAFMKDSEDNEDMKSALESVVSEIIKKDTLYEPMKSLRDEYPKWLDAHGETLEDKELERYYQQLEKIKEICDMYEKNGENTDQTKVFEMLA